MKHPEVPRFLFPQVSRVQLHAFSLYSLEPNVTLNFGGGVTCLAGANGIGKSTFLATVNYGLTGAVPDPQRRFLSAAAYLKDAEDFTKNYFSGRIAEADRDRAAVSIEFEIGSKRYSITRGLFDPQDMRKFELRGGAVLIHSGEDQARVQNEARYREALCADIGLSSFEQFVFLQHFLLTFDESRHLLFWNQSAAAQILHLCFGGDPREAAKADEINRDMEKAGSWGRNLQFQANNISKRIDILEHSLGDPQTIAADIERATIEYRSLIEEVSSAVATSEVADARLNDADLKVTQATAAVASYRSSYSEAFDLLLNGGTNVSKHLTVQTAISESYCPICRTTHPRVAVNVQRKLDGDICPLCDSPLPPTGAGDPNLQTKLAEIDARLAEARHQLEEASKARERLMREARTIRETVSSRQTALSKFEAQNQEALDAIRGRLAASQGPVAHALASLREARVQLVAQRDEAYNERDKFKDSLRVLRHNLEQRYAMAERTFVPRFRTLAELFLGIDLDISLSVSQSTGPKLELEMRGDSRREQHQLSESQRFFVDIALRMALAQHVSSESSPAGLFVDTPEGSLDIAYEDRAGEMFARFVESGHAMLMTANINSSKLLTTLARICGSSSMKIVQMTAWTELSDVQQRASELFQSAFTEITAALQKGPS